MNSGKAKNADYMFMVEHAIKAPSGHNTQPWLFKMNDNSIEIHPNPDKFLPVVDFDNTLNPQTISKGNIQTPEHK